MPEIIALVVGGLVLVVAAVAGLYLWPVGHHGRRVAPARPLDFDTATRAAMAVIAAEAADPEVRPGLCAIVLRARSYLVGSVAALSTGGA
ncbi:hypothetical protein [Micromonospora sp. WMMD710]|uniref:hypothetical protein n=1 Tax=Micromonospora sp. WMMD710 TaxID=3016085 RepID=UPI00241616F5|nr:hypothetical protein [Micromonospora sp. WMMD710]MDG4757477.1 hypothetical protein [Micromonospora sp. WMMD710]